jgi:hypothetical protein
MRTLLSALMAVIIVVCGCVYFSGCSTAKNPPVITSFSASPESIESGGSSTLSWTVNGARSVSLDNGIGNVAVKGTRAVTPSATTLYTLTATNAVGNQTASTQVVVPGTGTGTASSTSPSTTGIPAISSFSASPSNISSGAASTLSWSVANATSVNIQPGIGNVAASGSTAVTPGSSTQYTLIATNSSGSNQASTRVIVASGTTGTSAGTSGSFIDPNGTIPEQNTATFVGSDTATDPALQFGPVYAAPYASNAYDFTTHASEAIWVVNSGDCLTFPGSKGESQGYVLVLNNATLEDDKAYAKVLETHPKWVTDGIIIGSYSGMHDTYTIMPSDHFYAKVGFLKGATAGNVVFNVRIQQAVGFPKTIAEVTKTYDGSLTTIDVPLSDYVGQKAYFSLGVAAKNEGAKQDWAVWVNPRITR